VDRSRRATPRLDADHRGSILDLDPQSVQAARAVGAFIEHQLAWLVIVGSP